MKTCKDEVCKIISSVLGVEIEQVKNMNENEDLVALGMNSIQFISVVVALEETFEIEYPDEYLLITQSNTLNKLVGIVSDALEKKNKEGAAE